MPLSQFLIKEAVGEHDLQSPEGRARAQFDAKPMLQSMTPTSLRLQIVRGLAQLTQTTPSEIEVLFELAKPVAVARKAPPRSGRPVPVGLELQIVRLLVAHPPLALDIDAAALRRSVSSAPNRPSGWPSWSRRRRRWGRTAVSPPSPNT
jgi:DNA primase